MGQCVSSARRPQSQQLQSSFRADTFREQNLNEIQQMIKEILEIFEARQQNGQQIDKDLHNKLIRLQELAEKFNGEEKMEIGKDQGNMIREQNKSVKESELKNLEASRKLEAKLIQKKPEEKIQILEQEVQVVCKNKSISKNFQTYSIAKYEQQKLSILKEQNQTIQPTQIFHISQKITVENQEVLFHVISENLRRYQNRELVITQKSQNIGLTSMLFSESEDYKCLKFITTSEDYDFINSNDENKAQFIFNFKQKIAQSLKISISEIEILDIVKGSVQVFFTTKQKDKLNEKELQVLQKICGGSVEVFNYFAGSGNKSLVGLSSEDFAPQFNMKWAANYLEKEERGPNYHRYDYYFPRGYYGYALNVLDKYGLDNQWILMDGNNEEWRILYHGTKHEFMHSIISKGLAPGIRQAYEKDICCFTNQPVGKGVYFSSKISVCEQDYTTPTIIGNKKFILVFQSRVNPKAIRQSQQMKGVHYFLVNSTQDIRPYRILLKEV